VATHLLFDRRSVAAMTLALLSGALSSVRAQDAIPCERGLTFRDVLELVDAGVPESRVGQFVSACGVEFVLSSDLERQLRERQSTDALIALLVPPRNARQGARWTCPIDRREMVWIPDGSFQMGSPAAEHGRDPDETPHTQTVKGFWMDTREVTYEAFRRFLLANPQWQKDRADRKLHDGNYLKDWTANRYPPGKGDWPVVYVSWFAAEAYAVWAGKRLPTEAEWEFASRAGSSTSYWWGDTFFSSRTTPDPQPAGSRAESRQNPWGLFDVLGNVWEWTSSAYRPYPYRADDGREGRDAAGERVQRGGSWANGEPALRSANRNREDRERSGDLVGFRCAR
jgi:formylglycine-generating enzyme required for sulfatase activity